MCGAAVRSSSVSKSGTIESGSSVSCRCGEHVGGARRAGDDQRVERLCAVPGAGGDRRLDGCTSARLAEIARVQPQVEFRHVEAEELDHPLQARDPAVADPASAVGREALSNRAEVVEQICRPGVGIVVEPPPHERQLAAIRARARCARRSRWRTRAARSRRARATHRAARTRGRASASMRARRRARAPRRDSGAGATLRASSSASAIEAGPAAGLPSMSPPIQEPNMSGGGDPGTRRRQLCSRSVAAEIRLCSKNHSPLRISSVMRRRSCRTSSVCQSSVTSSARRSSTSVRSSGASRGSSSRTSSPAILMCASSTVRRVASVGCAVSTSRIDAVAARLDELVRPAPR